MNLHCIINYPEKNTISLQRKALWWVKIQYQYQYQDVIDRQ